MSAVSLGAGSNCRIRLAHVGPGATYDGRDDPAAALYRACVGYLHDRLQLTVEEMHLLPPLLVSISTSAIA